MSTSGRKLPGNAARNAALRAERLDALVKVLDGFPEGASKATLAALMRVPEPTVVGRLRWLRADGRAVWITVPGGGNYRAARWALTRHRKTAEAAARRDVAEYETQLQARRDAQRDRRTAKRRAAEREAQETFERGQQRWVHAARAPRPVTTAPNSVWQAGGGR